MVPSSPCGMGVRMVLVLMHARRREICLVRGEEEKWGAWAQVGWDGEGEEELMREG